MLVGLENIHHTFHAEGIFYNGAFFRVQVHERVGSLPVELFERVGKSVIWVYETVLGANR